MKLGSCSHLPAIFHCHFFRYFWRQSPPFETTARQTLLNTSLQFYTPHPANPSCVRVKAEHNLYKSPALRTNWSFPLTSHHLTLHPCWTCGRKLEKPDRSHTDARRMSELDTDRSQPTWTQAGVHSLFLLWCLISPGSKSLKNIKTRLQGPDQSPGMWT